MNELALFAGAGGGILGGHLLGWRTVCAVEWEPYPTGVLLARQNEGLLPPFPVWDDVRTFDGRPWRGLVDVVSGGFPCQDISVAGRGAGIDGERSGMWAHMARIIGEVRPRYAFVENSPALLTRGLGRVLGDLAALGYDCRWTVLGAADVGAPHQRDRIWIVAHSRRALLEGWAAREWDGRRRDAVEHGCREAADADSLREQQPKGDQREGGRWAVDSGEEVSDTQNAWHQWRQSFSGSGGEARPGSEGSQWWVTEPGVGRVAHGVAARVDRLKAIGNGQVPICAATAWRLLTGPIHATTDEPLQPPNQNPS